MNQKSNRKIREFWHWFGMEIDRIFDPQEDSSFINMLDHKISDFGDISWEIGPGVIDPKNYAFIISPNGDRDLLKLTSIFRIYQMA